MSIIAKDSRKDFVPAPEGLHQAVCMDVIDIGNVETQWGPKQKVRIVWQIDEINPENGKRFYVKADYNLSLNEKARLSMMLETWRGRKFTPKEREGFELENLVNVNCQIQIIHNRGDDGQMWANVQAVVPAPKGSTKLVPMDYIRIKDRPKDGSEPAKQEEAVDDAPPF